MNIPFLNPGAQFHTLRSEILAAVEGVLAKGHYILGPNVAALEQETAAYCGAQFGVGVNSGSDALTLALRAVGEVPLSLLGYGTELFVHLLLVATLAAAVYPRETAAADTIAEESLTEPGRAGRRTRSGRLAGLAPKGRAAPGMQAATAATPSPWGRRA